MKWFYRPKVQLGLFVNFVFILFTCFNSTHGGGRQRYYLARPDPVESGGARAVIPYVPLPPPSGPSRAAAARSGGVLSVYLDKDLMLVKKNGRTVMLSPSFSARTQPPELPRAVSLRFIVFYDKEVCPGPCPFVINADGTPVWTSDAGHELLRRDWKRERIPESKTTLPDGQELVTVASETLTTEVPYELFIKVISARRVIVTLGQDTVELTADQIETLRDMHRRLQQPEQPTLVVEPKIIKAF